MGERARRLADDLQVDTLDGAARALAEEAVLIVQRLEMIDDQLSGRDNSWWYIRQRVPDHVEIKIGGPMQEARQQAAVLAGLLRDLEKLTGAKAEDPGMDLADELANRRDQRLAGNG